MHAVAARAAPGDLGLKSHPKSVKAKLDNLIFCVEFSVLTISVFNQKYAPAKFDNIAPHKAT